MSFVETKKALDAKKEQANYKEYNITETMEAGLRVVKLYGVPVGVASSDEEEAHMIGLLKHYNSKLETAEDVKKAMFTMSRRATVATDLRASGMIPEMEIVKDGYSEFVVDGVLYNDFGKEIGRVNPKTV